MPKDKLKTRKGKKAGGTLPTRFTPRFWADADNRHAIIKSVKRRVQELRDDAGVDSVQKDILAQRAVFVALQLETQELEAFEGKEFSAAIYTQSVNCLLGLLKALGLNKAAAKIGGLQAYVEGKKA